MGLFSKKKPTTNPEPPSEGDDASAQGAPTEFTPPAPLPAPGAQVESQRPAARPNKKGKKVAIDPVDFLNLRAELMDVKARLMAAEQSRAIVESRLAALDATALALSNEQQTASGAVERLAELEARVAELHDQPNDTSASDAGATTDTDELRESQAALQARIDELAAAVANTGTDPDLLAKISELEAQVAATAAAAEAARMSAPLMAGSSVDPALMARIDELAGRIDAAPDHTNQLAELEARVAQVAAKADAPPVAPLVATGGPDADTVARLDELTEKVAGFEALGAQLAQLNARVSAQAEFGAQLSSLRDRITELQADTDTRREAAQAATDDADLRDRVNALTDRMAATEALAVQMGQLAERVAATDTTARQAAEQVTALEQRVDSVGTELANQLSELGRDIDGLAQHANAAAGGAVSDEVIDALRAGQVKLANEQARYEIAFRQDLAALAEHVRRSPK